MLCGLQVFLRSQFTHRHWPLKKVEIWHLPVWWPEYQHRWSAGEQSTYSPTGPCRYMTIFSDKDFVNEVEIYGNWPMWLTIYLNEDHIKKKKHAIITLTIWWSTFVVVFLICRPLWTNNICKIFERTLVQALTPVHKNLNLPTSILVHSEGSGDQAWSWFCTWGTCRLETTCTTSPVRRRIALEWEKPWCSWTSNVCDEIFCSLISIIFLTLKAVIFQGRTKSFCLNVYQRI